MIIAILTRRSLTWRRRFFVSSHAEDGCAQNTAKLRLFAAALMAAFRLKEVDPCRCLFRLAGRRAAAARDGHRPAAAFCPSCLFFLGPAAPVARMAYALLQKQPGDEPSPNKNKPYAPGRCVGPSQQEEMQCPPSLPWRFRAPAFVSTGGPGQGNPDPNRAHNRQVIVLTARLTEPRVSLTCRG